MGIQTAVELARELKPEKVQGTILIFKVVSKEAFERRGGSLGMEDGKNLNRVFPGDPEGTQTERAGAQLSPWSFSRWRIIISICTAEMTMRN